MKNELFAKSIIGMIHVDPLPGTPNYKGSINDIIKKAINEAMLYKEAGINAIMIENMHDVPYLKRKVGPEIISTMSIITYEVKKKTGLPIGIQVLAGANKEALAIANAADIDFIRAEGFVFAHIADEGIIESDSGELLRYRKYLEANDILILTDIKKKHSSHSITSDITLIESVKTAEFFLSDGIIITGTSTGVEPDINNLSEIQNATKLPIIIGSGITIENIEKYFSVADAFIVGSHFKFEGIWKNGVEITRVKNFMEKIKSLKNQG